VTIHVGSVGFLHVSDVLVTFASGPIESVRVDDVLYTGQMLTLLTWLYEFVSKRLKGARLRDGLPVARTETSRTDAKDAPESQQSPRELDSEEKTKSRRAAILRQSSLAAATREGEPGRSPKGEYGASTDHETDENESRADQNDTNHRGDGAETRETKLPALRRAGSWLAFPKSGSSPRGSPRSPGTPPRGGFDPGTSDSPRSAHTTWAPGASLNVPVLVAGVLVTMRGRTETSRDETRRDAGLAGKNAGDAGDGTRTRTPDRTRKRHQTSFRRKETRRDSRTVFGFRVQDPVRDVAATEGFFELFGVDRDGRFGGERRRVRRR
jgi:hypothetical protein